MSHIHIHAPKATAKFAKGRTCLDCKQRTRMLMFFTPWYGMDSTCIKCGRQWSDGQWMALDFCRGIRQKNIEHAKALWRRLPPVSDNHWGIDENQL